MFVSHTLTELYSIDAGYAFSRDLSSISRTSQPLLWYLGVLRNPTINYTTSDGRNQLRSPFYASRYTSISQVVRAETIELNVGN